MDLATTRLRKPVDFTPLGEEILETGIIPQIEKIVERYPDRTAITTPQLSLNYRAMNNAVNHLAHRIIREMGTDQSPIAVMLNDRLMSVVAILAVLKSGRPFLSLYPGETNTALQSYLTNSGAALLVTSSAASKTGDAGSALSMPPKVLYLDELQTEESTPNPGLKIALDAPYSINYTSGSTGHPKGVLVGHRAQAFNAYHRHKSRFMSPSDRVAMIMSVWHAAAYGNIMSTFLSGACLYPFDPATHAAQQALDWLAQEEISILSCSSSILRSIFGSAPQGMIFPRLRMVRLGGEPSTNAEVELFKAHTAEDCVLTTSFAASETGNVCEHWIYHDSPPFQGLLPVGFPRRGFEVLILDDDGKRVADGEVGEVCVSSPYLSLGYWNDPVLTARSFCPHPSDPQKRMYHTGDLGRWRKDGALEVLGRKDTQVKIRGFRVQLEAVDAALRALDGIKDAAANVDRTPGRSPRLIAYVSMREGHPFSVSHFRRQLLTRLPSYAIPSVIVQLDALPRSTAGKLARLELPEPTRDRPDLETEYMAPRNKMEADIAGIWERVLGVDGVGIEDSFFELGGDSLMVLDMTLAVEKALSRPVPQAFLKDPTIASLSALLANETFAPADEDLFAVTRQRKTRLQRIAELRRRITPAKLRRLATKGYAGEKVDWLVDLILGRYIVGMPYLQAREWALGWSQSASARRLLYRRRFALFSRWVASLEGCRAVPSEGFQMSMLTNMLYGLPADAHRKVNRGGHSVEAYKNSPFAYWQTLGEILDALPVGEASEQFPIRGTEHLMRAYEEGHGVVLLSFHGFPVVGGSIPLKRLLGLKDIPTISFLVPRRGTPYPNRHDQVPAEEASALNARVALLGQKTLQQGGMVHFVSDWSDAQGRRYQVSVAGRLRHIKAGFAELALNTGATIIPQIRRCLEDGRIQMEFGAPLDPGGGDRSLRVEALIYQYAAFIERSWAAYPEAMRWYDILTHFARPRSGTSR